MRSLISLFLLTAVSAAAQKSGSNIGRDLEEKRNSLPSAHQVFVIQQVLTIPTDTQASKRELILDFSAGKWRSDSHSGSGDAIRLFDGNDLFDMDGGGAEYVRLKHKKGDTPSPAPYDLFDWSKAAEAQRRPCGFPPDDRPCVVLESSSVRPPVVASSARVNGARGRGLFDLATGLMLAFTEHEDMVSGSGLSYQADVSYTLKETFTDKPANPDLFKLAAGTTEVKQLSRWSAAMMKKSFLGKPAPGLSVTDIGGAPLDLSALKGKTVLLDFWTTWCPPCRADAPALDKLYAKYGGSLEIVGISVSEDRAIVQKFLKEHPHKFPIILTSENDMPRPYQVGVFPTYIVIDNAGNLEGAVEGDQGFGQLKKVLKQAGMDTD